MNYFKISNITLFLVTTNDSNSTTETYVLVSHFVVQPTGASTLQYHEVGDLKLTPYVHDK